MVTTAENVELSDRTTWVDCTLLPGRTYRVRSIVEGTEHTAENAALLCLEVADGPVDGGRGLNISPIVGPYLYLATGPGTARTDRFFTVVKPMRRYGLRLWDNRGPVRLRMLTIEEAPADDAPTNFFISFDVEALPGRAQSDRIDRLVWGRIDGQEFGIRRICDVLEQYGLVGNFLVDFASCTREGDRSTRAIVDFLLERGHEVHMHLHTEWLLRYWGLRTDGPIYFDACSYDLSRRMLDFTVSKFRQYAGERPRLFRAGGFRINPDLVLAAGTLGVEALSNVRDAMLVESGVGGDTLDAREPFRWENGVLEIPVDLSPEPLSDSFEKYENRYISTMRRKTTERTFNIVMHSWSLTRRNELGLHDAFEPEHEERLHQICRHAAQHGVGIGYGSYLDRHQPPRPIVPLNQIRVTGTPRKVHLDAPNVVTCNVCTAVFSRSAMEADRCPGCSGRARHRQLRHALDNYGDVFGGRSVLACHATPLERQVFLSNAASVVNFDVRPVSYVDMQMDIQAMDKIDDASVDCFLAIHALNHVRDDGRAVREIARVLRPGGVFVSTVPYRVGEPTSTHHEVTEHYGSEAYERYGVGPYRRYGFADYTELLAEHFQVCAIPGLDPIEGEAMSVFLAYNR